jgi:hypothetical protein
MLGLPAWSVDPGAGVMQAGWEEGGARMGMVVRGRVVVDRSGRPSLRSPDAWLAAFEWDRERGALRSVEVLPGAGGALVAHSVDGVASPFDAEAAAWLRRLCEGFRRDAPAGWPGPLVVP